MDHKLYELTFICFIIIQNLKHKKNKYLLNDKLEIGILSENVSL